MSESMSANRKRRTNGRRRDGPFTPCSDPAMSEPRKTWREAFLEERLAAIEAVVEEYRHRHNGDCWGPLGCPDPSVPLIDVIENHVTSTADLEAVLRLRRDRR